MGGLVGTDGRDGTLSSSLHGPEHIYSLSCLLLLFSSLLAMAEELMADPANLATEGEGAEDDSEMKDEDVKEEK